MTRTRRGLVARVILVVSAVMLVEAIAFVFVTADVRTEVLVLGYERQLDLLEDSGALDRCDVDPQAFALPPRESGWIVPLRPGGQPWNAAADVPDLSDAAARATPGAPVRLGSRYLAWPVVFAMSRGGPCRLFYMTPPRPRRGMPLVRVIAVRLALGIAVVFALYFFALRPFTARIDRLASQTRALALSELKGEIEEAPDELGEVAAVINRLSDQARTMLDLEQQQRELLHELFADLAHDVRTPLASLKLSTDALAAGDEPLEVVRALRAEIEYLDAMFANLATIARLRSTVLPVETQPGDLSELVARVGERFAALAHDRGVTLDIATPHQRVIVPHDPLTLEQAVGNVVHNAIEFASQHVAIVLTQGEAIELRVVDDGPGVREADASRLTERRFRGAQEGGRKGLGLGLAIADQIVSRHGGALEIAPYEDGGTRVSIVFGVSAQAS